MQQWSRGATTARRGVSTRRRDAAFDRHGKLRRHLSNTLSCPALAYKSAFLFLFLWEHHQRSLGLSDGHGWRKGEGLPTWWLGSLYRVSVPRVSGSDLLGAGPLPGRAAEAGGPEQLPAGEPPGAGRPPPCRVRGRRERVLEQRRPAVRLRRCRRRPPHHRAAGPPPTGVLQLPESRLRRPRHPSPPKP